MSVENNPERKFIPDNQGRVGSVGSIREEQPRLTFNQALEFLYASKDLEGNQKIDETLEKLENSSYLACIASEKKSKKSLNSLIYSLYKGAFTCNPKLDFAMVSYGTIYTLLVNLNRYPLAIKYPEFTIALVVAAAGVDSWLYCSRYFIEAAFTRTLKKIPGIGKKMENLSARMERDRELNNQYKKDKNFYLKEVEELASSLGLNETQEMSGRRKISSISVAKGIIAFCWRKRLEEEVKKIEERSAQRLAIQEGEVSDEYQNTQDYSQQEYNK